jgi:murein L,D-transpeptidase YafK
MQRYRRRYALLLCAFVSSYSLATSTRAKADLIVVEKQAHTMKLLRQGKVLKEYKIALGDPAGNKQSQGDRKTPEGRYLIDSRNRASRFHLSLHISYPAAADRARAKEEGVDPGGDIFIHGLEPKYAFLGALHRQHDWTDGCIAVTNPEIEEVWAMVDLGTPVEIRP